MEKIDKLNYSKVILGGSLESLIHSFHTSTPLIMVNPQIPPISQLTSWGLSKKVLWERLSFMLSFSGLNPCAQKISSYRIEDGNVIKLFGKSPYSCRVISDEISNFDIISDEHKYAIIDNFKILNLSYKLMYVFKELNTGEKFINNIKISAARNNMRGIATSYLDAQETKNDKHTEIYARLKIESLLKENGMIGKHIGTIREPVFRPIKIELLSRETYPLDSREDELIDKKLLPTKGYLLKCIKLFGNPYDP